MTKRRSPGDKTTPDSAGAALVADIGPEELDALVEEHEDISFLDVRSAAEFRGGHIPGAQWLPPTLLAQAATGPGAVLVVYSEGGRRGAEAAAILRRAGRSRCYNLRGGLNAWRAEGMPIVGSG